MRQAGEGRASRDASSSILEELRYTSLSISGKDLLELGLEESPEVGQVLTQVKLLKLEGKVDGREERATGGPQDPETISKETSRGRRTNER